MFFDVIPGIGCWVVDDCVIRSTFAWGKAHGARGLTVRVSEHALAHYGAMPFAPCNKALHGAQYERKSYRRNVMRARWLIGVLSVGLSVTLSLGFAE